MGVLADRRFDPLPDEVRPLREGRT
jgi:hypothetical protein